MPTLLEGESAPHADERVPGGLALIGSSLATVGIAAVIAFYLLPVGFGLTGATLVLAQVAAMLLCAAIVASSTIAVRRHHRHRAALAAVAETLGWEFRTDIGDRVWGGSIDEQIDRGARTARDHLDARHAALPFDSIERTFVVGDREGATMHTVRAVRIPFLPKRRVSRSDHGAAAAHSACSPDVRRARPGFDSRATSATSSRFRCRRATRRMRSTCSHPT